LREAFEEAKLPADFTIHGLQYAAATPIFEVVTGLGQPERIACEHVAAITGYSLKDVHTILKHYLALNGAMATEAVRKLVEHLQRQEQERKKAAEFNVKL